MSDHSIQRLLDNNKAWSAERTTEDPEFFERLVGQQAPEFLWIGCADSRVPANQIVGTQPGEVFVHRNVANVVVPDDPNCLSAIQFAVDVLKVRHIIVCGHYGCGGVAASLEPLPPGPLGEWLAHVAGVHQSHREEIDAIESDEARKRRLCELNVLAQAGNVAQTATVRDAWKRGQSLDIHAWAYDLHDGLLTPLGRPNQFGRRHHDPTDRTL